MVRDISYKRCLVFVKLFSPLRLKFSSAFFRCFIESSYWQLFRTSLKYDINVLTAILIHQYSRFHYWIAICYFLNFNFSITNFYFLNLYSNKWLRQTTHILCFLDLILMVSGVGFKKWSINRNGLKKIIYVLRKKWMFEALFLSAEFRSSKFYWNLNFLKQDFHHLIMLHVVSPSLSVP